jgi:hypothetical protein
LGSCAGGERFRRRAEYRRPSRRQLRGTQQINIGAAGWRGVAEVHLPTVTAREIGTVPGRRIRSRWIGAFRNKVNARAATAEGIDIGELGPEKARRVYTSYRFLSHIGNPGERKLMLMARIPKYPLSLAGEYRICSELNKRGIFATVTYGNRKDVDVYAIGDKHTAIKTEVKTSQQGNFVTSITQKHSDSDPLAPDFWVLFQIQPDEDKSFKERFFVFTNEEICAAQRVRNQIYGKKYLERHGNEPDFSVGVDNLPIADVAQFENQWSKIVDRIGGPAEA